MRTSRSALCVAFVGALPWAAHAEPYRLRADALVQARTPTGLLVLDGHGELTPELGVEVLLWGGASDTPEADLLVAALSYVDAAGRGELRAGRLLVTSGALRPLHMDGVVALARLPSHTTVQAFAGLPTAPRLGPRDWDWAVGGRVAQALGDATLGVAYLQQRDAGQLAYHELGLDLVVFPTAWFDLGARGAVDLAAVALAELVVTAAVTVGPLRATLGGVHRSPAHLLPATSLFTVLGDRATRSIDGELQWRAAPRLDLSAGGGVRLFDDEPYASAVARAELRLSREARGGAVGAELRRQGAPDGGWTGARIFLRVPLADALAVSIEAELLRPDVARDRGALWPWGLLALSWRPHPSWEVVAATEAAVTPTSSRSIDALLRVSYLWGTP